MLLENLVKVLRNEGGDPTLRYESLLGDPVAVKSYANTGVQSAQQFTTVMAIILHEYDLKGGQTPGQHEAYREALADFAQFYEGCLLESSAKDQSKESEVKA